jgi:erythromycin esterase
MNETAPARTAHALIRQVAHPLQSDADLDPLLERIGDSRFVLLGEATHGTSEYYLWRARLTRRLIEEKGFSFMAVEGDWPDCYEVNRYIKGYTNAGQSAHEVLHAFERWPTWMWANWEVVAMVEWLRRHNDSLPQEQRVGFYGLDVYSLWESLAKVTRYLEETTPDAVAAAYRAYNCFQPYGEDVQSYAYATQFVPTSCEAEVVHLLTKLRSKVHQRRYDGDREEAFNAEQNALVTVGAERYYRTMIIGGTESWNVRDIHMVDTLERLMQHHGATGKAIVWEHNTHIGDARATPMASAGMYNVGQLVRERRSEDGVVLVGFGSHRGTVIAGRAWGAPMESMKVPEARTGSWEDILHRTMGKDSLLVFAESRQADEWFQQTRGHRAIGVVYDPHSDKQGSFVPTSLSRRYDAFIYLQESQALHPLQMEPSTGREPPVTYPWAF